ncbi:hypothetical protein [Halomonas sp. BM-2019]|uniref:hypothetical protein n=1 Tax=Halomonas sp. BM-2019 TaxID=2811227 RepID=UPI001B3C4810|nr:MAG: hypothetical protein J5F18_00950 [Halomonas sp. BM-2019]
MSLQRAYRLLAVFYSLLLLIGVIALLAGGGTPLALAHLVVGGLAVAGLWGYVLERGFMGPRMWRPLAVVLALGAVVQLLAVLTISLDGVTLTWMLTSAVFALLVVVILYRYGDRDQAIWATPEELEAARRLDALLEGKARLEAQKREGGREASVQVVKAGSEYRASVTRRRDGQQERFEERFHHPATLVFFLDKFTGLSVNDFQRPDAA